jgi:hypothetical protein
MDIKKIIDRVHEETGTSLGNDDPVFVSVALNKILLEESVKILKTELETSVLKDLPDLVIGLRVATASAQNIRNLNGDAENVQKLIEKYNGAEGLINKKIEEINKAAKLFNKPIYISLAGAFILAILAGVTIGHFTYKESLQAMEVDREFKDLSDQRLEFEKSNKDLRYMMSAKRNGIMFYDGAIVLPITNAATLEHVKDTEQLMYKYQ